LLGNLKGDWLIWPAAIIIGREIVLAGVVKGEGRRATLDRLLIYPSYRVIDLSENSEVMFSVQQIRDEAHRFAIQCHRKARHKHFMRSKLDELEGVGPVLKQRLLAHFGGLSAVLSASVDGLTQVEGVGRAKAARIYFQLHPQESD
jgi:excinuclease ABC subunit C